MLEMPVFGESSRAAPAAAEAFSFGDPEPVNDRREILDLLQCWHNGRWYEPPISVEGLARSFRASPHHSSAILLKRNLLVGAFKPTPYLTRAAFEKVVQDYLVFGFGFLEQVPNRLGGLHHLKHSLAKATRRGVEEGRYFFVPGSEPETEFRFGSVLQIMQPDVNQEIYGVPEYISALQSTLLNEAATLFRRKYYINGSHAGFILHATGEFADGDVDKIREALRQSKGPGNFRNLFVHQPGGKEGGIKIHGIAEVGAKDEFLGIKNATRDDILAAHRVPPQLLGVVPAQGSAFGNPTDTTRMFWALEMYPLMTRWLDVNEQLGGNIIAFDEAVMQATIAAMVTKAA
ncbi:phage portal protein [Sphingomonas pseudosanguinis]|uniref:PBSX family phage portal protein n=1 Tax=Sphingomonas pseudosanguinis TaxID=413712 RepID=A0A7W6A957_9SPHN|nr:phage portal protein [Sphingomonas pseudosanguinis]MBB3877883.1 PBSX family phage portal protein [Sphingomonas pseudosanguinis]MBN3537757.1 phage portal protein [Sphingomonas pseudosanguinis]